MKKFILSILLITGLEYDIHAQNHTYYKVDSIASLSFDALKIKIEDCKKLSDTVCTSLYAKAYLVKAKNANDTLNWLKGYEYFLYPLDKLIYADSVIRLLKKSKNSSFFHNLSIAYYIKGGQQYDQRDYDSALSNFLKVKELSDGMDVNFSIALIKSRFGKYREALKVYKKAEKEFGKNPDMVPDYLITLYAIGDAYRHLNLLDSASYYNSMGYKKAVDENIGRLVPYFSLNEAATDFEKGNFKESHNNLHKILPAFHNNGDVSNLVTVYYFLGRAANKLDYFEQSINAFKKVDSLTLILNDLEPEYRKSYEILINHYQKKKDFNNELKYVKRLLSVDSILNKKYETLSQRLVKEYDTPLLLQEKEQLISKLKKEKKNYSISLFISGVVIILIIFYVSWILYKQKIYRKRLESLLQREQEKPQYPPTVKKDNLDIRDEIVEDIINKLYNFEKEQGFIKPEVTMQVLASDFNTNTRYLSKIINHYKNKNFSNYINDLRINYAIERLKSDKQFKKYTIKAIAQECGFNTSESFANAFFKNTGIMPSFFIKNIEKYDLNS